MQTILTQLLFGTIDQGNIWLFFLSFVVELAMEVKVTLMAVYKLQSLISWSPHSWLVALLLCLPSVHDHTTVTQSLLHYQKSTEYYMEIKRGTSESFIVHNTQNNNAIKRMRYYTGIHSGQQLSYYLRCNVSNVDIGPVNKKGYLKLYLYLFISDSPTNELSFSQKRLKISKSQLINTNNTHKYNA